MGYFITDDSFINSFYMCFFLWENLCCKTNLFNSDRFVYNKTQNLHEHGYLFIFINISTDIYYLYDLI